MRKLPTGIGILDSQKVLESLVKEGKYGDGVCDIEAAVSTPESPFEELAMLEMRADITQLNKDYLILLSIQMVSDFYAQKTGGEAYSWQLNIVPQVITPEDEESPRFLFIEAFVIDGE